MLWFPTLSAATWNGFNHIVPDIETKQDPYAVLSQSCEGDHFEGKTAEPVILAGRTGFEPPRKVPAGMPGSGIGRKSNGGLTAQDFYMAALLRHIRCYGLPQADERPGERGHSPLPLLDDGKRLRRHVLLERESLSSILHRRLYGRSSFPGRYIPALRSGPGWSRAAGLFPVSANGCGMWWEYGFDEFLSADYMCVTMGALLNVVDFAPEEESAQAFCPAGPPVPLLRLPLLSGRDHRTPGAHLPLSAVSVYAECPGPSCTFWIPTAPWPLSEWLSFLLTQQISASQGREKMVPGKSGYGHTPAAMPGFICIKPRTISSPPSSLPGQTAAACGHPYRRKFWRIPPWTRW